MRIYCLCILLLLIVSCNENPIEASLSRDQFSFLLASDSLKTWEVASNGTNNFLNCEDNVIYIFEASVMDTGNLFIREPLLDCNDEMVLDPDTTQRLRWTLTETESSIFDNQLFIIDGSASEQFEIQRIDPTTLVISSVLDQQTIFLDSLFLNP